MTHRYRTALFIDGASIYLASRQLDFDINYERLLSFFQERCDVLRAFYYNSIPNSHEHIALRPLIDWLDYNGYSVVTKIAREPVDPGDRRRGKAGSNVDLAVAAMEMAGRIDQMVLFSGDGDLRSLVEAVQRKGVRVCVVSTLSTQPSMVATELRRQADEFVDLRLLAPHIGRNHRSRAPRPDKARRIALP